MADPSIDVEALLVQYLGGMGFTCYAGELPHGWDAPSSLPVVRVVAMPGRESARAWNGPGLLSAVDVDVDVFGADQESVADAAAALRNRLETWSTADASVSTSSIGSFGRRPDWNENIRRRGAVLSLVTR